MVNLVETGVFPRLFCFANREFIVYGTYSSALYGLCIPCRYGLGGSWADISFLVRHTLNVLG
jgi:hypothetical protein